MSPGDSDLSDFSVVIPLDVKQFELELIDHPNRSFVTQLLTGIREGFDISYMGPELEPRGGYTSIFLTGMLVREQISTIQKNRMTLNLNPKK